jgi:hypothetical protein
MVLVILLTNVLIRKREMMKVTQNENTQIKAKELQIIFSRKYYAPKKTNHHQIKMKLVTVRHEEFYSWQQKTLAKKTSKKNMKKPKKDIKKSKKKLKRQKLTIENNYCVPYKLSEEKRRKTRNYKKN